jgi:hypothetical protein
MNRFEHCKSLKDLYDVFATEEGIQDFENLLDNELERIAIVFEANIPTNMDMPDVPLTKAGYNYIWDVVVDFVEMEDDSMNKETMNNATVNNDALTQATINMFKKMEDDLMNKDINVKVTVDNAINNIKNAASSAKVHLGDNKEDFVNRCDNAINDIKNNISPILTVIDDALGLTSLKDEICSIMYETLDGTKSKNSFFKMAEECRKAINRKIAVISIVDPDDKLGKIAALRYLIAEDAEGNKIIGTQTIWMAFAKTIVWICKKVHRKLTKWFKQWTNGLNLEENIFGAICSSIAKVFATISNVVKNIGKVAGTLVTFVGSYAVAGVIKIAQIVVTAFKWVASKFKGWYEAAKDKLTQDDVQDDEDLSSSDAEVIA